MKPPVMLTPAHLDDLDAALADGQAPLGIADLERWSGDDLNALRYHLSLLPLERPAVIDGASVTVDALIDRLVDALGAPETPAVRVRPWHMRGAELDRVRAAMERPETLFYVDGEPEPMDDGLLFDSYEDALFPEAWGDEDTEPPDWLH